VTDGLFITGTSTEVGKTYVGARIAAALVEANVRVGVYKPVASGCRLERDQLVSDDAVELWQAAGRPATLEQVCPQRFRAAIAPHRAAAAEGRSIDPDLLLSQWAWWRERYDVVLVEGAGGLMSPLTDAWYNLDLAVTLALPLVVVAANQLGVINATLQTVITAQARAPQLPIAGVILNTAEPLDDDASLATNAEELATRCPAPLLATLDHGQTRFTPPIDWQPIARMTPPK
jgi:dethiobiotin synthetase